MNDWIHAAHSLTKTSTTAVQTFMSPLRGLVGVGQLRQERLLLARPPWKHTTQSEFDIANVTQLPRVDIIFAYADMSPDLIDAPSAQRRQGHRHRRRRQRQHEQGRGRRRGRGGEEGRRRRAQLAACRPGIVGRNVELNDDKLGFIASDELNPQKARILLTLALLKNPDAKDDSDAVLHLLSAATDRRRRPSAWTRAESTLQASRMRTASSARR